MFESVIDPYLNHETILQRMQLISNNNRAYWVCNDEKIISRAEAVSRLSQGQQTLFSFNAATWTTADWSQPADDLAALYIQRAIDIRKKYSYVRIAYSGGVDSHTILTAFRDAGIAPDEIFFWTFLDQSNKTCATNYELHRTIVKHLPTLKSWFPQTKFSNLNFDLDQFETLRTLCMIKNNWPFDNAGARALSVPLSLCCFNTFDIADSITLTGSDKPRIDKINGQWYAYLIDTSTESSIGNGIEGFYHGQDPTIHITQCHAVKQLLETNQLTDRKQILKFQNHTDRSIRHSINHAIKRSRPFDDIVVIGKKTVRQYQDVAEHQPKVYLLRRELRKTNQGRNILQQWDHLKQQFQTHTGVAHTVGIFGHFYNLNNGQVYTVDQLFPNGWNLNN